MSISLFLLLLLALAAAAYVAGRARAEMVAGGDIRRLHSLPRQHGLNLAIAFALPALVGYADTSTLRTLLRRKLGRGIRQLRCDAGA